MKSKQTEILILGSFDFLEENILDIFSYKIQKQIKKLTESLATFNADKIAVESNKGIENIISKAYEDLTFNDFSNTEKMRTAEYGLCCQKDSEAPVTCKSEHVQIGFRLGKMLEKDEIYSVDYLGEYSYNFYDTVREAMPEWGKEVDDYCKKSRAEIAKVKENGNILEVFRYYNSTRYINKQHELFYLRPNIIGVDDDYKGADFLTNWYKKNARIFANIQKLSEDCERVFILFGAEHLHILREMIKASSTMKLVDIRKYLND